MLLLVKKIKMKSRLSRKNSRRKVLIILVCTLLLASILFMLEKTAIINLYERPRDTDTSASTGNPIGYGPPTAEDLEAVEKNKDRLIDEQERAQNQNSQTLQTGDRIKVTPMIGYIESDTRGVRANGFISTMIEEGGTCTFTLSRQGTAVEASHESLADAQSTVCGLMEIGMSRLSPGNWTATISYSSDRYAGVSEEKMITVN